MKMKCHECIQGITEARLRLLKNAQCFGALFIINHFSRNNNKLQVSTFHKSTSHPSSLYTWFIFHTVQTPPSIALIPGNLTCMSLNCGVRFEHQGKLTFRVQSTWFKQQFLLRQGGEPINSTNNTKSVRFCKGQTTLFFNCSSTKMAFLKTKLVCVIHFSCFYSVLLFSLHTYIMLAGQF